MRTSATNSANVMASLPPGAHSAWVSYTGDRLAGEPELFMDRRMFPSWFDHPRTQMLHDAGAGGDAVGAIDGQIAGVRVDVANGMDAVARGVRPPGTVEGLVLDAAAVQAFDLPQGA